MHCGHIQTGPGYKYSATSKERDRALHLERAQPPHATSRTRRSVSTSDARIGHGSPLHTRGGEHVPVTHSSGGANVSLKCLLHRSHGPRSASPEGPAAIIQCIIALALLPAREAAAWELACILHIFMSVYACAYTCVYMNI